MSQDFSQKARRPRPAVNICENPTTLIGYCLLNGARVFRHDSLLASWYEMGPHQITLNREKEGGPLGGLDVP